MTVTAVSALGAGPSIDALEKAPGPDPFAHSQAPARIAEWLRANRPDAPTVVIDTEIVARAFAELRRGLGADARIHYAIKACPEPRVLSRLAQVGCRFDAASRGEIEAAFAAGATAETISFGNTIKREVDIAWAASVGVTHFTADSVEEIEKIARAAPGARIMLRLAVENSEADWPLSRKFGARLEMAPSLIAAARALGLTADGIAFHPGSQTREPRMWASALDAAATLFAADPDLRLLNIGGGFPAGYLGAPADHAGYGAEIRSMIDARFPAETQIMAEPGRALSAEAGVIEAEVVLATRRAPTELARWVYLSIGRFSGLAETEGEAIRYPFETAADGGDMGPCIIAGPSCDSADILYEKRPVQLPLALKAGDRVRLLSAGAYTSSYSSVGFNGFPPLQVVVL